MHWLTRVIQENGKVTAALPEDERVGRLSLRCN